MNPILNNYRIPAVIEHILSDKYFCTICLHTSCSCKTIDVKVHIWKVVADELILDISAHVM